MLAATVDGIRIVSLYAPNGRVVGSPFYEGKLPWFERLGDWLDDEAAGRGDPLVLGGDFNVAPTDADVWDPAAATADPRVRARARRVRALLDWGLVDVYRPVRRARPVLLVGLPGREVPQELRDADRPCCCPGRTSPDGSWTPRSIARRARAMSRPTTPPDRPRRTRPAVRPRLGGRWLSRTRPASTPARDVRITVRQRRLLPCCGTWVRAPLVPVGTCVEVMLGTSARARSAPRVAVDKEHAAG